MRAGGAERCGIPQREQGTVAQSAEEGPEAGQGRVGVGFPLRELQWEEAVSAVGPGMGSKGKRPLPYFRALEGKATAEKQRQGVGAGGPWTFTTSGAAFTEKNGEKVEGGTVISAIRVDVGRE